ncbi:MAG: DNA polymerase III subunit gamma/tau [Erysipelotrichaceae bacterium]|nr:DNA polymerase III subunit gamma/tau [Erysipelotrichaceae bacterium]
MAYKALYRTYRPNSFEEVVGQKYIVTTLKNAVEQKKIAHAYLFCGPRGTGKTTVAKLLAKAVNCKMENAPCNECESCKMIQEGTHPDIVEIDAASNNGVDEIRNLIERVKYAPLHSKYKVYIVDEVHMLTAGAFNALLKTLEEPPPHIIFILATTEAQKVIPTIISRCQRFDFGRVSIPDIIHRLKEVLEAEDIKYEKDVIPLISDLAEGGVRDALSILDQVIAYAQNDLKITHVNEIYGITTPTEKFQLIDNVIQKRTQELLELTGRIIDNGMDIKRLTNDLIEILKECVVFEYTNHDSSLLSRIEVDKAEMILEQKSAKQLLTLIDVLIDTAEKYRFASDINSYFEVALLKMMTVNETVESVAQNTTVKSSNQEDITKEEKNKSTKRSKKETVDYEVLLQLLTSADKKKRLMIEQQWNSIIDFENDVRFARYVSKLKNCSVKAKGDGFILVATKLGVEAQLINKENEDDAMKELLKLIFNETIDVTAITDEVFSELVILFKERQANNTLPPPLIKKHEEITIEIKESDDINDKMTALFGDGMFDIVD